MEEKTRTKEQILKELHRLRSENARLKEANRKWEKTKNALAEAEQRLDMAIRGSKSGLWDITLDSTDPRGLVHVETYLSLHLKELIGYEDHEFPNSLEAWIEQILPEDLPRVQKKAKEFISGRVDAFEDEYRIRHKDGSVRWHQSRGRLYREADGAPLRWSGIIWDITERKQAEIALSESEERYRELFNNMKSGVAVYKAKNDGEDFIFMDFNEPGERIENIKKQHLIDKSVLETFPGIKEFGLFDVLQRVWKTGRPERHSNGFYQDDRIKGWRENYVYKLPSGEIVAVYDNITERKQAEIALSESEERYRAAFELAPVGVGHVTAEGKYLLANRRLCEIAGYSSEELRKMTTHDITHPDDEEEGRDLLERMGSGELSSYAREKRYLRKDGSIVWVHITVSTVRDSAGRPRYYITVVQDISERKKAEDALKESEERFRDLARFLPETIFEMDLEGKLTFVNEQAFVRFGYTRRDFDQGLKGLDMIADKDRERAARNIKELMAGRNLGLNEYTGLRKDGSAFPILMHSTPIIRNGTAAGIRGFIIDISERKKAEEALKKLAEDLKERVKELNCLYSVSNFLGETGKSQDETLSSIVRLLPAAFLYPEKTRARITLDNRNIETDNFKETENRLASNISTPQGETIGVVEIFLEGEKTVSAERAFLEEEITLVDAIADRISDWWQKKRAEEEKQKVEVQLRQAQKMEAIGTLAGGIAHDFNNILAVIMGHTEIAQEKTKIGEDDTMETSRVLEAAIRASNLIKQILTFSRNVEIELKPLNLNHEIAHSVKLLERTIPKMIGIELHLADDLKQIKGDSNQMEQVLMNLTTNAIDAMPLGGRLVIQTENILLDDEFCNGHIEFLPGRYIFWQISDTGDGIDEETQKHIFDPFFTTKEVGKGTGLGLSIVYGIVKSHGGHIICYSHPGMGTTFKVYLPALQEDEAQIILESERYEVETGGEETVLVVDDEKAIRESTTEILKRRGYKIFAAASGEEALKICKEKKGQIDLVILDVGMPGMGGLKCFEKLIEIDPKIKILIASGYSAESQLRQTAAVNAAGFIGKPYRLRDMLSKLREILGAKD